MKEFKSITVPLVVVGAVNWGLVGLMDLNIVSTVFSAGSILEKGAYLVIGAAGLLVAWDQWGDTGGKKKK